MPPPTYKSISHLLNIYNHAYLKISDIQAHTYQTIHFLLIFTFSTPSKKQVPNSPLPLDKIILKCYNTARVQNYRYGGTLKLELMETLTTLYIKKYLNIIYYPPPTVAEPISSECIASLPIPRQIRSTAPHLKQIFIFIIILYNICL